MPNNEQPTEWEFFCKRTKTLGTRIIAGIVKHPQSGCWQTVASLFGDDLNFLTTHRERADALRAIAQFADDYAEERLFLEGETMTALRVASIKNSPPPAALPPAVRVAVGKEVARLYQENRAIRPISSEAVAEGATCSVRQTNK